MHKMTKECNIKIEVKKRVYERDKGECILCGKRGFPNAHFIPRSKGGLGIEENIITLCVECHQRYDNSKDRKYIKDEIKSYLKNKYPYLKEEELIYKKGR